MLELFEVAQAWQIDVLVLGMPGWIQKRRWEIEQDKSELEDLYARAGLPDSGRGWPPAEHAQHQRDVWNQGASAFKS